jgi:DNA primase
MRVKNFDTCVAQVQLHLNDYLQERGINTAGMFKCINPEHKDHSPSCSTGGGDGTLFQCFGCGSAGDIFKAAHFLEDKPLAGAEWIIENLTYLANKYNIPIETTPLTDDEIYELSTYRAYKFASDYITSHQETEAFKKVITERNWTKELCAEYSCGTTPSFKEFREHLKDLGFGATFLDEIDLGRRELFDSNNFIFTIKDEVGRPIGFASRNLDYTPDKLNGQKYVNQRTTGPRCNIYRKGSRLFGMNRLIKTQKNKSEMVYIFEGYSDVLTAVQNGLNNCVAIGGTAFTVEQLQLLKEHNFYSLCMALDGDQAGQERMMALLDTTLGGQKDIRINLVMIPAGQDPDEFIRANGIEEFKKLRKWSAFEWRLSKFSEDADPETLCKSMVPLIVNESSSVNQEKMERILAEHTGVTQRAIHADVETLQNAKEAEKKRERQKILDKLSSIINRRPDEGEGAIQEAQEALFDLAHQHNEDSFS